MRAPEHVLDPVPRQLLGLLGALLLLLLVVGKEDVRTELDLVDLGSLLYQFLGSLRLAVSYEPPTTVRSAGTEIFPASPHLGDSGRKNQTTAVREITAERAAW